MSSIKAGRFQNPPSWMPLTTSVAASSTTLKPSKSNWRRIEVLPAPGAPVMMNRLTQWLRLGPHLKRRAARDAQDQRREPVILAGGIAHDRADCRHVAILQTAAQRVGQQLFGHG